MIELLLAGFLTIEQNNLIIPYIPDSKPGSLVMCLRNPKDNIFVCQNENYDDKSCMSTENVMVCKKKEIGI